MSGLPGGPRGYGPGQVKAPRGALTLPLEQALGLFAVPNSLRAGLRASFRAKPAWLAKEGVLNRAV